MPADEKRNMLPVPRAHFTLQPKPYNGPRVDEVLLRRQNHLSAGQYHFYNRPLMLVEACMQYCFDDTGKQYIDCYSNVCHVGHCHPHFVSSTQAALENILSNTRYLHPTIVSYAEKLKSKFPPSLNVCYFVNSGSEANDLALRLARIHTARKAVVCLEHAYHGTTASCTGISTSLSTGTTKASADYEYCARDIHVAPVPDPYRGIHRAADGNCGQKYADEVKNVISGLDGGIAAFIHESVQGVGGQIVYPKDFLAKTYDVVHKAGGVCIADEVQTGFGRSGSHFWAFEVQNVTPDIVVMGKPIGNGFPLGAVVTTREIANSFNSVQYFNTYGGNPVAAAAGLAVLNIIDRDNLQENAKEVGRYLTNNLLGLQKKHACIGDVRGVGLYVGVELVRDRTTLEPAREETAAVMEKLRPMGILVGKGGAFNNVIRVKPPLCFTKEDADCLCNCLDSVLTAMEADEENSWFVPGYKSIQKTSQEIEDTNDQYVNCASPVSQRAAGVAPSSSSSMNTPTAARVSARLPSGLADAVEASLHAGGKRCRSPSDGPHSPYTLKH